MAQHYKPEQGDLLPFYWLNGELRNSAKVGPSTVPTLSQAMDYSVVLIEGIRINVAKKNICYGFRLGDYIKRMIAGCESLNLKSPFTFAQISSGLHQCIDENLKFLKANGKLTGLYVRPKFFLSDPVLKPYYGNTANVVIECVPFGKYLPSEGIAVTLADFIRTHRYSGYTTKGAGKYVEYGRLRDQSTSDYADVLQLGLGKGGKLIFTEGTSSNLFFVNRGKLLTAGVDDFILNGITRDSVLKMAKHLKIQTYEGEIGLSSILEAEEIFLTGTASFITPVKKIGKYELGVGPITKKMIKYFEKVRNGEVTEFNKWLTKFKI